VFHDTSNCTLDQCGRADRQDPAERPWHSTCFNDTKQIDGTIGVGDVLDLRFVRAAANLRPYRSAGVR
jgi:hypothetical protein